MQPVAYYRILANSDTNLFFKEIEKIGFVLEGRKERNPLVKTVEEARVRAIASTISEDQDDNQNLEPELQAIKELAEALGFIVSYESA
jgi:hypothetical protein